MFGTRSRVRARELAAQAAAQAQKQAEQPVQKQAEPLVHEQAEPPVQEQAEPPVQEQAEPLVHEQADTIDEEQDVNLREAGQDIQIADKPPQRLYSLYQNLDSAPPGLRQSSQGERLLNWLRSIKPYRHRRCRSDTNVQLLPEMYNNIPPISILPDSTIIPQDQGTFYHSAGPSRLGVPAPRTRSSTQNVVERADYRDTLQGEGVYMLEAGAEVPSGISSVIEFITSGCGQPSDTAKSASSFYSADCTNKAIGGANEEEVRSFFDYYLFSGPSLPGNVRRNGSVMKRHNVPAVTSGVEKISAPNPDLLLGYNGTAFPSRQINHLSRWDTNYAKFPFLSVDYKGDGAISKGRLWVAINQCMVATTACVRIMTDLRDEVPIIQGNNVADSLDLHVFGLVSNGTEARLFVTFAGEQTDVHVKLIRGFLLYDTSHRVDLERCVEKIWEWAKERQRRIEAAVDAILERNLTVANMTAANMTAANMTAATKRAHGGSVPPAKRRQGESATESPTDLDPSEV